MNPDVNDVLVLRGLLITEGYPQNAFFQGAVDMIACAVTNSAARYGGTGTGGGQGGIWLASPSTSLKLYGVFFECNTVFSSMPTMPCARGTSRDITVGQGALYMHSTCPQAGLKTDADPGDE